MKSLEYLKNSLKWGCYRKRAWFLSAFSIIKENEEAWKSDPYKGRIIPRPWGYDFINEEGIPEKIEDGKPNQPLFEMLQPITIDGSWIVNLKGEVETFIGSLLVNQILLVENFGDKIPYIAEDVTILNIEAFIIQNRSKDNKPDPKLITIPEMLRIGVSCEYLKTLGSLSVHSLTERNILPPKGITEFKQKLIAEYGNSLSDPVKLAEFEQRLKDFDNEYMKGDPSNNKLVAGKIKANGRRKLFLSSGAEGGLKGAMVPVTHSLVEGIPLEPKSFVASINGARAGSYFRGVDTVKGGVSAKISIRALAGFEVVSGDCGSIQGISRIYTKYTVDNLVGRKLAGSSSGKVIQNLEEAKNYIGKPISVRSPMYCLSSGQTFCEVCAGHRLGRFRKGLSIPATDMTSAILAASMAAMHKNTTTTTVVDFETALT